MRKQKFPNQWKFHPKIGHLSVEKRHVVEDLDPVQHTVIDLILDQFQKVMVTNWVFARFRRQTGYEQDTGFIWLDKIREMRVVFQPFGSLLVPIRDFGAETVGFVRVGFSFGFFSYQYFGVYRFGLGFGLGLLEDAMGLQAASTYLVEVLLWVSEFSGSDSAM